MKHILKTLIALVLILNFSCKKEKPSTNSNNGSSSNGGTAKGSLSLKINHLFDGSSFELNKDYRDDFGNLIQYTRASFYIALPQVRTTDEEVLTLDNNYFLVDQDTDMVTLINDVSKNVTVDSVSLNIGVDLTKNHEDPSLYGLDDPLAFQSPSMHWSWTNGYLFMVIEGNVDTDGDDVTDDVFGFHIGMDSYLGLIQTPLPVNISVNTSSNSFINLDVNYDLLFKGIDLSTDNITHTMDNPTLATSFFNNYQVALELK